MDEAKKNGRILHHCSNTDEHQKENHNPTLNSYRHKVQTESSDDEFDQYLVERATPKEKKKCTARKNSSPVLEVSSDSDGYFETFLSRMKTPKAKKTAGSDSADRLKHFIVDDFSSDDDFVQKKPSRVKSGTASAPRPSVRTPLSQCNTPVFLSDSDDEDAIVKSTWRTRHKKTQVPKKKNKASEPRDVEEASPSVFLSPLPPPPHHSAFQMPLHCPTSSPPTRNRSAPSKFDDSSSSGEEFASLLDRLKMKNATIPTAIHSTEHRMKPLVSMPAVNGPKTSVSRSVEHIPVDTRTPGKSEIPKSTVSQTEPRPGPKSRVAACKTPGCFLRSLSVPGSGYERNFKQNKESLTSKLYQLYNTSIFDGKLPANMSVTWNKKMRKTAGYCITGQERGGGGRYARIELSEKVCDSADRLRDTLVHEMCHAATWLINGVRDGHGSFWKVYAKKSTLAHPELPMVTRCHSYDIKYKYQYQCVRCKNTIGRHSKSLDTQRFACALCTGSLVLLTPSNPRAPTPFANFVKDNYGTVRQELAGKSHAEVMRKLSADFATKTKLSQS